MLLFPWLFISILEEVNIKIIFGFISSQNCKISRRPSEFLLISRVRANPNFPWTKGQLASPTHSRMENILSNDANKGLSLGIILSCSPSFLKVNSVGSSRIFGPREINQYNKHFLHLLFFYEVLQTE